MNEDVLAVSVNNLCKNYGAVQAVTDVSFAVPRGRIFALIGPNGAGKSTTLRILATILTPTSGTVRIYGFDVTRDGAAVRRIISYLPEEAGAYKTLTGRDYLEFMAGLYAETHERKKKFVAFAMEVCGLGKRLNDKIKTYSKGMTRKLLLARAIMVEPKLAILDEPTSGLDVINALEIRQTIRNLTKTGMAVLLSSHNMLEIEFLSDHVGIIDNGRLHETGTSADLKNKYQARNLEEVFMQLKGRR